MESDAPHISRVYDYLLGGTVSTEADRAVAARILAALPAARDGVRGQRDTLIRVVRYLAGEAGISQFLDIGSGLPTAQNVHEVATGARVVYVDYDPVVVSHSQTLLDGSQRAVAVHGDVRDPAAILAVASSHLDFTEPVALLLCGVLYYVTDEEDPSGIVATLTDSLPAGSYVFIQHLMHTDDPASAGLEQAMRDGMGPVQFRTHAAVLRLFGDLDLVDPGLVTMDQWRPDPGTPSATDHPVLGLACAGVAVKR